MKFLILAIVAVVIGGVAFVLSVEPPEVPREQNEVVVEVVDPDFAPIPEVASLNLNPLKVKLGESLFHDRILSGDKSTSCSSCHNLDSGGVDNRSHSIGVSGELSKVNSPTVFNSSLNFKQFWDGRADTLEEQVSGPLKDQDEMGLSWEEAVSRLNKNFSYRKSFSKIYSDGITADNIANAIAEFERSLLTPNSAFDLFLKGEDPAYIETEAGAGYLLFKKLDCVSCHNGVGIGGGMFQRMGAKRDLEFTVTKEYESDPNLGRYNVTKREADRYRFKVPSLRNVALTAPYFHDGSAKTLKEAIEVMARHQLARRLKPDEIEKLESFLKSLTGQYQGRSLGTATR